MAVPFRTAVHGEVLGTGVEFVIRAFVGLSGFGALQSVHDSRAHLGGKERVFAVSFLAASPPWVAEDVDVGRPEGKPFVLPATVVTSGLVVFGAGFIAYGVEDLVEQLCVERRRHAHGDGEHGGHAVACDTVEGFAPPVELRDAEPFYGRRRVLHQAGFFFERETAEQIVGPLVE